jgi:hypothetical protein
MLRGLESPLVWEVGTEGGGTPDPPLAAAPREVENRGGDAIRQPVTRTASQRLGGRQLLDHALAGPLPLLQEDQEIGHLLPVRPLVELPDQLLDRLEVESKGRAATLCGAPAFVNVT